jgi:hypothetical protein
VRGKQSQTISFSLNLTYTYGETIDLTAGASSGLPITFTASGPATISGISSNILTITGAGPVTVTANQPGDATYSAAPPVFQIFTVLRATPVVNATGGTFPYDGTAKAGSGTATGGAGEPLAVTLIYAGKGSTKYGPTNSAPSAAGAYTVTASTAGDANNTAGSSSAVALTINQATPVVNATGGTFPYDGTAQPGSGTATGGAGEPLAVTLIYAGTGSTRYGPKASAPSAAGTYTVTASTAGDANNTAGSSSAVALTINQATPVVNATGGTFPYNGTAKAGSGTATGGAGENLVVTLSYAGTNYGPKASAPSAAGTYTVTASTAGDANNTAGSSSAVALTINRATPVVNATGGTFPYNGTAKAGSGTATGGAGEPLAVALSYAGTGSTSYGPTNSAPSAAGTYTVTASTAGDANNTAGSSSAVALTINQATPVVNATGGTFPYNGTAKAGSGTATGGAGENLVVTLSYAGTNYGPKASAPSAAGTYTVTASTAGDANNTAGSSSAVALTINRATPVVNATGGTFPYNGTAQPGSGTATGGAGETLAVALSYAGTGSTSYGPTTNAPSAAGTYTVTASTAGDANNTAGSSSAVALTINKASLSITAINASKVYGQTLNFAGTEFTPTGLVGSDSVSSVTLTSAGATNTAPVANSPYIITPSSAIGSGLGNYSITYNPGYLTVSNAVLTVTHSGNSVIILWPSASTGFVLQQNSNLATTNWTTSSGISDDGTNKSITITSLTGNLFFRLSHP